MHSDFLYKEVQALTDVKVRLEEESQALRRKVMDSEDSNNALRKQLVDARRCTVYHAISFIYFHCSLNVCGSIPEAFSSSLLTLT